MRELGLGLAALWMAACGNPAQPPESPPSAALAEVAPAAPAPALDVDDPRSCAACHGAVVEAWRGSMHASAHHDKDPLYGAMRTLRMEKQGAQIAGKCATCHNPRSPDDTSTPAAHEGVSCATCHLSAEVAREPGKLGVNAITWAEDGVMRSARDVPVGRSPVHGTGPAAPHLADGTTMCLACHDATTTPSGAPACTTGPELAASASGETCVSCHMPLVDAPSGAMDADGRHRSHAFVGPHRALREGDAGALPPAVGLEASLGPDTLRVTLTNRSGHAFPSGFPGRVAVVVAVGRDASGAEVWRAWTDDAMKERPDALLNKVYVDADGKPVLAPFSQSLQRDNRLKPDEIRTLSWAVPAEVASVAVSVIYRLIPPPGAAALGLTDHPVAAPRKVVETVATR